MENYYELATQILKDVDVKPEKKNTLDNLTKKIMLRDH